MVEIGDLPLYLFLEWEIKMDEVSHIHIRTVALGPKGWLIFTIM